MASEQRKLAAIAGARSGCSGSPTSWSATSRPSACAGYRNSGRPAAETAPAGTAPPGTAHATRPLSARSSN